MTSPKLIPYALEHTELGIIITLKKLSDSDAKVRQAWKDAPTTTLYKLDEDDSQMLLDLPEVNL